jgi:hypothetical protein
MSFYAIFMKMKVLTLKIAKSLDNKKEKRKIIYTEIR